jgi:hypothetical protein
LLLEQEWRPRREKRKAAFHKGQKKRRFGNCQSQKPRINEDNLNRMIAATKKRIGGQEGGGEDGQATAAKKDAAKVGRRHEGSPLLRLWRLRTLAGTTIRSKNSPVSLLVYLIQIPGIARTSR